MHTAGEILFWVSEKLDQELRTCLVEPQESTYQKCEAAIYHSYIKFKFDFVVNISNTQGVSTTSLRQASMY
jgi:hypothetical protein